MIKSKVLRKLHEGSFVKVAGVSRVTDPWLIEVIGHIGYDVVTRFRPGDRVFSTKPHQSAYVAHDDDRYREQRFILAHAARGFNPYHTIGGIGALRGLTNIWCYTSAVNEGGAFEAIVETLGVERLLYGSDFPISHLRGRCVAIGDSFLWLHPENVDFSAPHGAVKPTLIGLESLRVLKRACLHLRLKDREIERIFRGNAAEMYSLT